MSRAHGVALSLAVLAGAAGAQAAPDWQSRAFVRVEIARPEVVVGEVVPVRIVVGVERDALEQHAVQLFRQPLDLPAQIVAPWFDGADGVERMRPAGGDGKGPTLAVNDAVVRAQTRPEAAVAGRAFAVVAIERRLRAATAGTVVLAAPTLRLAFATAFRDDFVNGRVPVDRADVAITGIEVVLTVREVPTEGRPADFTGAVGEFTVAAEAAPRELAAGERMQLTVIVRGDGDLRAWAPPPVAVPGFHVLGVLDRGGLSERTLVYELSPLDDTVQAVPRVGVPFFVPGPDGGYRTAWTEAIALRVRGGPGSAPAVARPVVDAASDLADIKSAAALPRDVEHRLPDALVVFALSSPWLLAALFSKWRGRARGAMPRGSGADLAAAFASAAERRDVDLAARYDDYLVARIGESARASDGGRLRDLLRSSGVTDDLAMRASRLRQSLLAGRYAGISVGAAVAAQQIVRELELAFDGREREVPS